MSGPLKGGHVLMMFIAFFGVMMAVNGAMAYFAVTTFSGEDVSQPYQKGLEFNKTLAARAAQAKLGWHVAVDLERSAGAGGTVAVTIKGKDGAALDGLTVNAFLRRPTDATMDKTMPLSASGNGVYSAAVPALAAGQWDVIAQTTAADGTAFEAHRRIDLP